MTYYADLAPCDYFGPRLGALLAVGWLDSTHQFTRGTPSAPFCEALIDLASDPWEPARAAGRHACELCVLTGGPAQLSFAGRTANVGTSNLLVPAESCVYIAPSLVLHYIDAHGYMPPAAFQTAVLQCPPMRSMEYLKALRRHGVAKLPAG